LSKHYWGMDRFRVQSLTKLLSSGSLDGDQGRLVQKTLLEKVTILRNGASKRAKLEDVRYYDQLLKMHGSLISEAHDD